MITTFVVNPLFTVVLTALLLATGRADTPIAIDQLVVVQPAGSTLIRLTGYDKTTPNSQLVYTIKSPPTTGSLYQLSQVFSAYGYEPKGGAQITSTATVTGSNNRVYYVRPSPDAAGINLWDRITFTANNGATTSYSATITLVPPSGALVGSDFLLDNQGWTISGNKQPENATFEAFSRGGLLNHYIYGTDDLINVRGPASPDVSLWYFQAPSSYMGNWGIAYGGTLSFNMGAFSGDFTNLNGANTHLVELECAACVGPVGMGITLAFPISALVRAPFTGDSTAFSIPLVETSGWMKDPQNSLLAWTRPTTCDMIQVLSRLSGLRILGDWTTWYESIAIDNVQISNFKGQIPLCAMARPDASVCTC